MARAIKAAKEKCWVNLCDTLEKDPWGLPYRIVMKHLHRNRLLYAAPFWVTTMNEGAMKKMIVVQRRIALRVAICYHTVSYAAANVVRMPPLRLLAEERKSIYLGADLVEERARMLGKWQAAWQTAHTGRWTHRLIGDVRSWNNRPHGILYFHVTRVITGHGCFRAYLFNHGIEESDE